MQAAYGISLNKRDIRGKAQISAPATRILCSNGVKDRAPAIERVFNILNMSRKPVIAVPADRRLSGDYFFHMAGEKYLSAVAEGADAIPLIVPAMLSASDLQSLLGAVDGVLLSGSPSNVEPSHYGGPASEPGTLHDPARDATTLPLIPQAVAQGVPLLAICRGFQEMNVAYGGTLWQRIHEVDGHLDHREDATSTLEDQYAPAHTVTFEPLGLLRRLAGQDEIQVNSLHWQGVRDLGSGLTVEARAPDGIIEAFRDTRADRFAVGIQWHPEWEFARNAFSRALFAEFGAASRQAASRRHADR